MYREPRDYDYDGPDFKVLNQSTHISRKVRPCEGCAEGIQIGEKYEQVVFLEDGKFGIIRYHRPMCRRDF